MPRAAMQIVHRVRAIASSSVDLTDGECLERYVLERDSAAFAVLVQRHGRMVLGVCQRLLPQCADAEDAFQAVFLLLARDGSRVQNGNVAGWLHTVAQRTARHARARRKKHVSLDVDPVSSSPEAHRVAASRELQQALDEELSRVSADCRSALVLCFLEELTQDEAAQRLGWSLSTFKRRLERGRQLLRARLKRRGFAPALLATGLSTTAAQATPGATLIASTLANLASATHITPAIQALLCTGAKSLAMRLFIFCTVACAAVSITIAAMSASVVKESKKEVIPVAAKGQRTDGFGDPLPDAVVHRFGSVRFRQPNHQSNSAIDAAGRLLAVGSWTGVTIFDLQTGERLRDFRDAPMVNAYGVFPRLAMSPDGKMIAHLSSEFEITVRDVDSGKKLCKIGDTPRFFGGRLGPDLDLTRWSVGLHFSKNGKELFAVADSKIVAHDPKTGRVLRTIALRGELAAISPDEKKCVVRGGRNQGSVLSLHDLDGTGDSRKLELPDGLSASPAMTIAFSPDGKHIAGFLSRKDGGIVWDAATGKIRSRLALSKASLSAEEGVIDDHFAYMPTTFSADSTKLYVGGYRTIHGWEWKTAKALPPLQGHSSWRIYGLFATADGKRLISNSSDSTIRRWDLETGREIPIPAGYSWYTSVAYAGDGKSVAVWDGSERIDLWNPVDGKLRHTISSPGLGVEGVDLSPDGKLVAGVHQDGSIRIWMTATAREAQRLKPDQPRPAKTISSVQRPYISPDGKYLLATYPNRICVLWQIATGKQLWELGPGAVQVATFSGDSKTVATTANETHKIILRDARTSKPIQILEIPMATPQNPRPGSQNVEISGMAFSEQGDTLTAWDRDAQFRIWELATGKLVENRRAPCNIWREVARSHDGRWFAAADDKGIVHVWEKATWKVGFQYSEGNLVVGTRFSPDGKLLATSTHCNAQLISLRPELNASASDAELWAAMRGDDAAAAYRAIWTLSEQPSRARALLESKISGPIRLDMAQVKRWIEMLDSDQFTQRETGTKNLAEKGRLVAPQLKAALAQPTSVEMRMRLDRLLSAIPNSPTAAERAQIRAAEILERIGDARAKQLLQAWAKGAPKAILTREALTSLHRLKAKGQ